MELQTPELKAPGSHSHNHYYGAASQLEILKELNGQEGFFIEVFFVNDKVNGNKWQITWEGIKQDIQDVVGVPIVLQDDLQHPEFAVQNFFAKGYIVDYKLNEKKHEASVIARILDATIIKLIQENRLKFVSPAVVARDSLSLETINGVDVLTRWIALHLALVANPAYGKTDAVIHGMCQGKGDTCQKKLHALTAAELATLGSDGAKVGPLTQTPFLRKADIQKIITREHSLLDQGIPEHEVHKILLDEFGEKEKDNPKTASFSDYIESKMGYLKTGTLQHDGKKGYWITANDMKVFVSNDKTVDQAIAEQCPCQFIKDNSTA